jgi:general receptor for phosphoinositides 1-associated scaffold protein
VNNHYDLNSQMASHCSLHSCNSNEYCQQTAGDGTSTYTTSLSTDTLWDPKSEPASSCNRQNFKQQRPSSVYHQPTTTAHSYIHRYVHPSQVQPIQSSITTTHAYIQPQYAAKPKSWDNLAMKGCGGYAIGYVVNNTASNKQQINKTPSMDARAPPLPRKSGHAPYGRYSAYTDVENYIAPPQQYVQEATITKTTIITTKSTENLINNAQFNVSDGSCECINTTQPSPKAAIVASNCVACVNAGYYSNLARNNSNRCMIPTKTEITRL